MESQATLVLPSAGRFTGDSDGAGSDAFDARITKKSTHFRTEYNDSQGWRLPTSIMKARGKNQSDLSNWC